MKGLIVALQFLTRLPMPRITVSSDEFAASMRWFPAAGLVVGAIVAGAAWAGARLDSWTGALLALTAWVLVTGALHLDGLGDVADASGAAHKDKQRLLAVLADPHIGSFGVTAIALQLLAKLVLLHAVIVQGAFLALCRDLCLHGAQDVGGWCQILDFIAQDFYAPVQGSLVDGIDDLGIDHVALFKGLV